MNLRRNTVRAVLSLALAAVAGAACFYWFTEHRDHKRARYAAQIAVGLLNPNYKLTEERKARLRKRFNVPDYCADKDEIALYLFLRSYAEGREVDTGASYYLAVVVSDKRSHELACVWLKEHLDAVPWDTGVRRTIEQSCNGPAPLPPQNQNRADHGAVESR
jgi:hypothetical protein